MRLHKHLRYDPHSGIFSWVSSLRREAGWIDKKDGYRRIQIGSRSFLAHRLAWLAVYGELPSGLLDHKNGDRSDNRIANLRRASRAQNAQNAKAYSNSPVKLKGVSPSGNNWRARVRVQGRLIYLGSFSSKEEAHAAYCAAARQHFGEFFNPGGSQ